MSVWGRTLQASALLVLQAALTFGYSRPASAEPFNATSVLNHERVTAVTADAFQFMAPRTLDATPVGQMALWGLHGLTTIDRRLLVDVKGAGSGKPMLSVSGPDGRVLLTRAAPPADDASGWSETVAQSMRVGWDASDTLRRLGTEGILHGFFDEMFNHFDPYSRYVSPKEAVTERQRRNGRAGVGITVVPRSGGFVAAAVQAGSPAAQAAVKPGDRLLAIDGASTHGADLLAVQALLGGPENTTVTLTLRGRDDRTRQVELARARVPPETVLAHRQGTLLILRIAGFSRNTGSRVAQELIRGLAEAPAARGVVIDLRGNRGGVLQQAVAASAMLQAAGAVVGITEGRDPDAAHTFISDGKDLALALPVVVLVDGDTASAAEILAASLADQRRAVVVGSATLGKGLVQTIHELPDGAELVLTWSRVIAPLGWPLQGLGVLPQVCTSLGQEPANRQLTALAHGRQPMAADLARHRRARTSLPAAQVLDIRSACPAAEGRDIDVSVARFLVETPSAYAAALLPAPERAERLTAPVPVSD